MSASTITASPTIIGWVAIAAALGVTRNTAARYARLPEDALPVRMRRGIPRINPVFLDEWTRRQRGDESLPRIHGWAEICSMLDGIDVDTAALWAKLDHDRLPVHGMGTRRPWAYVSAVRDWGLRGDGPVEPHRVAAKITSRARRIKVGRDSVSSAEAAA